jgi:hypothetical protein
VAEPLLSGFVPNEQRQRMAEVKTLKAAVAACNDFNARQCSFAGDHSALYFFDHGKTQPWGFARSWTADAGIKPFT